jgi:hypothetical protein
MPVIASDPAIQKRLREILFLIRKGATSFCDYDRARVAFAWGSVHRLRYYFFATSESFFHT